MADEQAFDLDKLRELIALMDEHGLTEISLSQGDHRGNRGRGGAEAVPMVTAAPPPPQADGGGDAPPDEPTYPTIDSPTVGTFYSAPSPDDPPFVKVGQAVSPDSVVCIVEAMKVFNQIQAETAGTIVEVLVEDGDAVEFGQPLFRIQPT